MAFGLTIGTERAIALQNSIQDELTRRGFSSDPDPVMAEYITIMVINNKTAAQITSELEDLIGSDYDPSFTEWLFAEAAQGAVVNDAPTQQQIPVPEPTSEPGPSREPQPTSSNDSLRRVPNAPRSGVYHQAISQAIPSPGISAQKRSASARSPSPSHPNKSRRTDVPTGPRAMNREGGQNSSNPHPGPRSLLDRVGGHAGPRNGNHGSYQRDDIQARIDDIVNSSPDPNMMMAAGFPGMGGMDMSSMAANMGNPLLLQEMMMNQMALMAQMASTMGIINPGPNQFGGPGFPMQGVMPGPGDMGMFQGGMNNGFQGQQQRTSGAGGSRGGTRGGRGAGRGRGGSVGQNTVQKTPETFVTNDALVAPQPQITAPPEVVQPVVAPTPIAATSAISSSAAQRPGYAIPERPQSPTLCKFGPKCTNAHCRYSHPSPVATAESGVVLSNEACENGKDCKDKDCVKAHVSPAVLNPQAEHSIPPSTNPTPHIHANPHTNNAPIPCRFGAACTRPNCTFGHPPRPSNNIQCRFGAGCTRATCTFQHPEGRVLPTSFHRGLSTTSPMVHVSTPETGTMGGGASPHKSVTFNNANVKEKLEKQMKEIEEKKREAEQAVKNAQAAASSKKDETKHVELQRHGP